MSPHPAVQQRLPASDIPPPGILMNGRWLDGAEALPVLDKYTGEPIAQIASASRAQVDQAVAAALAGFDKGAPPPVERARILERAADIVQSRRKQFISLMIAEAGFTAADAAGDFDRSLVTLRLCAEEATRISGETVNFSSTPGQHQRLGFTIRVPLGVICAITPFNSPLNTVLHKIGPAIAAGNSVVLKPSNLTPLSSAALSVCLLEAGLPPGLLSLVQGPGSTAGNWLVENQAISFYAFTGSTETGRTIQRGAGLRRTQMELGSIASTILCKDADLDRAVPKIANASFRKAGQVCTSTQRLYVEQEIFETVSNRLVAAAVAMTTGDPFDPATRVGPMITEKEARRAESWIEDAAEHQARVLCGGRRAASILEPTVIAGATPGLKVVDQEIFAPCVCLLPFTSLDDAIKHANSTPFGLSSGIFTGDVNRALRAAQSLRFGAIHINEASSARADAMPFGGVKDSGFGHEGPKYAIRELTEERLVTFNL